MIYVTVRQKSKEKEITWWDLIEDDYTINDFSTEGSAGTITRTMEEASSKLLASINVPQMINTLRKFNEQYKELFDKDRNSLYEHFYIPKKTGGLRPIDAPCKELQDALRRLVEIMTDKFGVLYHTSAFAYVKNRNTMQAVYKHQRNESNWFYKTDVSGFFPNTTLEFTMKMLSMIFPLSEVCKVEEGRKELERAISLGFLNGTLPQGSALSPMLTNVISIPIDHKLFNDLAHKKFVYTRYADDVHISCVQKFDPDRMTNYIQSVYEQFGAPWKLKPEKTHYGSRKGHNYLLGYCLNAENNITVGYRAKRQFKAMTASFILDHINNKSWSFEDIQHYKGLLSYYKGCEKEYFEDLIRRFNLKYSIDLEKILKDESSL